ncbi:hypothetical protein DB723_05140 (plasmid) [Borrelia maritima]|uniref:Uncharacterized protein n=1 Tax=Borrelia maritima TaxID=2761123 RepID=A0A5J6WE49_9SPIR|nr:hypothetical protein DB723_05140 [Borrelia maritima]
MFLIIKFMYYIQAYLYLFLYSFHRFNNLVKLVIIFEIIVYVVIFLNEFLIFYEFEISSPSRLSFLEYRRNNQIFNSSSSKFGKGDQY